MTVVIIWHQRVNSYFTWYQKLD